MCRSKVKFLDAQTSGEEEEEEETLGIFHTSTPVKASKQPWTTTMVIDQVPVRMEIDTGSWKSLIGKDTWKQSFHKKKLRETLKARPFQEPRNWPARREECYSH